MKWVRIVVHHSATRDAEGADIQSFRDYHRRVRLWRDLGYHFVVERLGGEYEVVCGRPLNQIGAHVAGANAGSIGVCFAGDFTRDPPPIDQLAVGARLVAGLMDALSIDIVTAHRDLGTTATSCPGDAFPIEEFKMLVLRSREDAPGGVVV